MRMIKRRPFSWIILYHSTVICLTIMMIIVMIMVMMVMMMMVMVMIVAVAPPGGWGGLHHWTKVP